MQTLRQWMALPMFATAAWLVWVLKQQSGSMGAAALLGLLFLLAGLIGVWRLRGMVRRFGVAFFSLALLGLGVTYGRQLAEPASQEALTKGIWQPWSSQRVQAALQAGHPVLVDYTAAWCVTCQFNKKTVLEQQRFLDLAHEYRLVLLRADWTRSDPAITASLRSLGRSAVPTYAVYHPGAIVREPLIVTELLTLEKMRRALENTQ
jgi:thiol:disulfide interchange protein DsbD